MASLIRKNNRFQKNCLLFFVCTCCIYVLGTLCLNSIESSINIEVQRVEDRIENQESVLDGLNTARQEKVALIILWKLPKQKGMN